MLTTQTQDEEYSEFLDELEKKTHSDLIVKQIQLFWEKQKQLPLVAQILISMQRDGLLAAISKRRVTSAECLFGPAQLTITSEVADFDINEGPSNPSAFAGFEEKPPPAPKLHSEGVVAMDNTQQFIDAAQSTC